MAVTNIRGQQILNGSVQYVDIQQVTASRLVGNPTGSAATMSEISLGTGLSFSGSSVVVSTNLQSLSGLSYSSASFVKMTAAGTFALDTATYITGNQTITLSGDVSGSGNTAITTTLATVTQTSGSSFVKINIDGKGRVTGNTAVASGDITTALGYTPYNSTNPNSYISAAQTYYIGTTQNALNRSSAAQTLTGVSIDGNAGTANYLKSPFPYNVNITDNTTAASLTEPGSLSSVNMHANHSFFSGFATTLTMSGYDRYGAYQISGAYNAAVPDLAMRSYYQGTSAFTGWVRILSSSNFNTYAPTLTGGGASGDWSINVSGYSGKVLSTSVTNVNTQRTAGYLQYFDVDGATGAPGTSWFSYISVRHGNPSNEYGFQFANGFGSDTLYWRGWDGSSPLSWRTIVHSGNIGSFETDTLATVMSRGASSSTYMTLTGGGIFSGNEYTFRSNVGSSIYLGGGTTTVRLQAYSDDGGAAYMTFHRSNAYAVHMGLDPDNVFRIGGFSAAANRLQLNMSGDLSVGGSLTSNTNLNVGTDIYLSTQTSPYTGTLRFGDNSGWVFRFQTSVSSTWTTRFSFTDGGTFTAVGDVIAYSDARVKTNVVTIKDSLEKVQKLRGVTYNRTDSTDDSEKIGVIAQEIQKVLPQVVSEDKDGMLGVSYGNLAGVFIEAIKEQQTQIEDLKKQIQYLVENR